MHLQRIESIQQILIKEKVKGILISNFYNILYLTGFKTLSPDEREAFLLITSENVYLFTDGRYVDSNLEKKAASINAKFKLIEYGKNLYYHLNEIIKVESIDACGFEREDLKYAEFEALKQLEVKILPLNNVVMNLREIKNEGEVEAVKKACIATDDCLSEMVKIIKVGMSEKELAWKIESWIHSSGYECAFDPIVAADLNSAIPHYDTKSGTGIIKDSSVVLVDFGTRYKNYNSDITRMIFVGEQDQEVVNRYNYLLAAQEKSIKAIKKGKSLQDIDTLCREELLKNEQPDFQHSTGHGVGLEVHEFPKVSKTSISQVAPHQVLTIEPGIYLRGRYGMRIEDTVLIDENYSPKLLTQFPKQFLKI